MDCHKSNFNSRTQNELYFILYRKMYLIIPNTRKFMCQLLLVTRGAQAQLPNCQLTFLKTRQLFPDSRLLVSRKLEKNLAHRQSRESHSIVQNCTSLVFVMLRCLQPVPITKICSKAAITVSFSKFFSTHNPATERKMTALELQHLARKGENSCSSFC